MKKFKKVLILYASLRKDIDCKPFVSNGNKIQIERLFKEGENAGIKFYRAPIHLFNPDKKCFTKAWSFDNSKWIIVNDIIPDVIFDKVQHNPDLISIKNKIASIFKFVNNPAFDEIANNKFITYCLFKIWMPKSYLVYNKKDINNKLKYFKENTVIVKPVVGSGGIGVKVLTKKEIKNIKIKEPSLLQEFIDSSYGIKNVVKEPHDLRIIIFNKKVFGAYLRVPRKGSFVANITQGGCKVMFGKNNIPKKALNITKEVISAFDSFDDLFYSVDFIFNKNQKPYILEINSMPGFSVGGKNSEKFFDSYYKRIIKYFLDMKIN